MDPSPADAAGKSSHPSGRGGILLIAHGSRDAAWAAPFERLRERIALRGGVVELAYLERMTPDFADAA